MWLGREVSPRRPTLWLTTGVVAAVNPPVVIAGGTIYNDNLMLVFCTLLIAVTVRMLRNGATPWTLVLFGLFTAGALWVRFTSLITVGLCGLVLGLAWLLRRPPAWRAIIGLGCASLAAVASITWFYQRNLRTTGNLAGTRADADFTFLRNRAERPFHEVILDPATWRGWHTAWGYNLTNPLWVVGLQVGIPLLVAAVLATRRMLRVRRMHEIYTVFILAGLVIGIILVQADFRAHRGGGTWRYMKPQLPAIALGVAWTLTASRRLAPLLVPAWVLAAVLPLAVACVKSLIEPSVQSTAANFPVAATAALVLGVSAVSVAVIAILLVPRETAEQSHSAVGPSTPNVAVAVQPLAASRVRGDAGPTVGAEGIRTETERCPENQN
jgi:4-amino-4-deoxy-L-arabinose transferase-like glycosyltransferase